MSATALKGVEHPVVRALRAGPPVLPPVQLRVLLAYGRACGWTFHASWKWSFECVRMPHDTAERREWREILGTAYDDERPGPAKQRAMWRRAYERAVHEGKERGGGRLLIAA